MANSPEFVAYLLDKLAPLGRVSVRAIIISQGLFRDRLMFAPAAGNELFLNADDAIWPEQQAASGAPFGHGRVGKPAQRVP